jgi:hypothetical protein
MFRAGSAGRIPDEDLFPWLPFLVMDQARRDPLIRSFERHLRAENRSERTIATYLIDLSQDDAFLHPTAPYLRRPPGLPDAAQEAADRAGKPGPQRARRSMVG